MRIDWEGAPRVYSQGLDRGVLYFGSLVVPWFGLISIDETSNSTVDTEYYIDGVRHLVEQENGDYSALVEAYTYPDELETLRGPFNFSYRTELGDHHEIHVVYNAHAHLSERNWRTLAGSPESSTFRWDISATPTDVPGSRGVSHLVIDTSEHSEVTEQIENLLYGTETTDPSFPTVAELVDIFESVTMLKVVYNGDGTWTATGPDEMIQVHADGSFDIVAPSAHYLTEEKFIVSSY